MIMLVQKKYDFKDFQFLSVRNVQIRVTCINCLIHKHQI